MKGLDVSHYQNQAGSIDWIKAKEAGYDFVYIKATESSRGKDNYYALNISNARKAGFIVGSYHFARANKVENEAKNFLDAVGEMEDYDFLVLDWEIESENPDSWCRSFLDICYEKTGVRPFLYTNQDRVNRINWKKVVEGNYALIVARYGNNDDILCPNEVAKPDEFPFVAIQQFTSNMQVPGFAGRVDANITSMDIETFKKYGKQPGGYKVEDKPTVCEQKVLDLEKELLDTKEKLENVNRQFESLKNDYVKEGDDISTLRDTISSLEKSLETCSKTTPFDVILDFGVYKLIKTRLP